MDANILIVDDSPGTVSMLNSILSSEGCQVQICGDGKAGWRHLIAGARGKVPMPDVLLLALNMPGLDGLTLLSGIRSEERLARLPVIVITADTDLRTRSQALGAGADDYLSNPLELPDLVARVKVLSAE